MEMEGEIVAFLGPQSPYFQPPTMWSVQELPRILTSTDCNRTLFYHPTTAPFITNMRFQDVALTSCTSTLPYQSADSTSARPSYIC
jgi:hypothetical protein